MATATPRETGETTETPAASLPISFDPGETSTTVSGHLGESGTRRHHFVAQQGQPISVSVAASEPVRLIITQRDYLSVRTLTDEQIGWRGELPASAETLLDVSSTRATPYTLTLKLPPSQQAAIELVEPDGNDVWLEGTAQPILWRSSGIGHVDIEAASGGKAWLMAAEVDAASGRYVWEIPVGLVSNFGVARSAEMSVRVSSSRDPALYDQNDRPFTVACPRITFDPGATSATVNGRLEPIGGRYRYVLEALEGQAVALEVSPASLEVAVWGAEDGSTWEIPSGSRQISIDALPATQDYFITLMNPSDSSAVDYVVGVVIR